MAKVEIISSCLDGNNIVSSIPRVELISWDLLMLPRIYLERGLIFQKPQELAAEDLIAGLKSSLSRTLEWFSPLAGQLCSSAAADGNMSRFFVECNNAGALFRHAVAADVSVADILEAKYTPQVVYSLFPRDGGEYNIDGLSQPLLAVQVTELADGIFVGCRANHCVVDGGSFWHFINSWAEISRGLDTISKPPVLDRRSCFPGINDDGLLVHVPTLERNLPHPSPTAPHKFFHFSREIVGKLKAKANSEAGGGSHRISSLQAVLSHIWRSYERCLVGVAQEQEARLILGVGTRARMEPPLPETYFGNAVIFPMVATGKGELLDEKGLGHAALKINEVVSQQTNDIARRDAEKKVEFPAARPHSGHPPLLVASSPRYDVYGNDFGWGKPVGVRTGETMKRDRFVVLFPTPEAGGIDVELCLPLETLEAMESDADFVGPLITD